MAGLVVCSIALFAGFVTFRENRLDSGIPIRFWNGAGPVATILLAALLLLILGATLSRKSLPRASLIIAILGNVFIIVVFISLTIASESLLLDSAEFSRVSVGPGAWLLILGGYVVIASSTKGVKKAWAALLLSYVFLIALIILGATGALNRLSVIQEFIAKRDRFTKELVTHVRISFGSVGVAMLIGIPAGIVAYRKRIAENIIFFSVNTAQTIPSLALFGLLIVPLSILSNRFPFLRSIGIRGIGTTPALIALTLYALLPITRNTYTSLKVVESSVIESGRGMGMNNLQILRSIEIPLATPILLNGLRLASVQAIGNTAVAALIGAGGLGFFIFQGLGQAAADLILLGAIPVVILAVIVDRSMQLVVRIATPVGLRKLMQGAEFR